MTDTLPALDIKDLIVDFDTPDGTVHAVKGVSLRIEPGEIVAIVGESGSGKSQIAMTTLGILASNGKATGSIRYKDRELLGLSRKEMNTLRGSKISIIFQEPMTSLDPLYRVGEQIIEPLRTHGKLSKAEAKEKALDLMRKVQIPDPERRFSSFPNEMSGGQRQRIMIAMALANDPDVLIADEPTTALDVTTQAEILKLLASLNKELGMSIIFITHDLGIVEAFADRVYVMRRGIVMEHGPTDTIFNTPETEYTRILLDAEPDGAKTPVADSEPLVLEGDAMNVVYGDAPGFLQKDTRFHAVKDTDVQLRKGQTIGLVGESGSGKSTLGRALLRLTDSEGKIVYAGRDIDALPLKELKPLREELQMVFQDPYGSLSPRLTVSGIVEEGLQTHRPELDKKERKRLALEMLEKVGLDRSVQNRFPHEFSGGQRQRIAIARAMVLRPKVVVLDEPTSALDRTVQKEVLDLLRDLQNEFDLSYIFISHDLAVIKAMADYVMVMRHGEIIEEGITQDIFERPQHDYTKSLIKSSFELKELLANA
ncbi:MAG: ABC transporter ATP-binding protein [Pseudomonadota bacterium]